LTTIIDYLTYFASSEEKSNIVYELNY